MSLLFVVSIGCGHGDSALVDTKTNDGYLGGAAGASAAFDLFALLP